MNMRDHSIFSSSLRGIECHDAPMKKHVSWRTGGTAARTYTPADLDDLGLFLRTVDPREDIYFVGLGSNLLVRDGGFHGTVIFTHGVLNTIHLEAGRIHAGAGVASPKVARFAATHGFSGAEFLAGIPGTVGGALAMNAGCYGAETWDVTESVMTIDRQGGLYRRGRSDFEIDYRHVMPLDRNAGEEWFVTGVFAFEPGDETTARTKIRQLLEMRVKSQPLNLPNAGSVFRNPPENFAARLIEQCGLKGLTVGHASVSEKHANFIVNPDGLASAKDIETLIELVRDTVRHKRNVDLIPEVRIIGRHQ